MVPDFKTVLLFSTTAITSTHTVTAYVDTQGYDYCTIDIHQTTEVGPTQTTALAIRESDTTTSAATDGTAIEAFTGGAAIVAGTSGFVLPTPLSDAQNIHRFNIDLRGRKRYLMMHIEPTSSCTMSANAFLSHKADGPAGSVQTAGEGPMTAATRVIVSG